MGRDLPGQLRRRRLLGCGRVQDPGDPRHEPDVRQRARAALRPRLAANPAHRLRGQPRRLRQRVLHRRRASPRSPTSTTPTGTSEQTIKLVADVNFDVPIARDGAKIFPVTTHGFWKLQGPLAVEGGVTGADRSLELGLKLPGEADGPLFKIGTQPPESKQIDVLNMFNDGSKENRTGTMTSTTLSGLGLPKDLDFGPTYSSGNPQTFGEPAIFPGGIGYGTVQFVDGTFTTNGAKSTIEVVNLMLGIGNDSLDIQGTIDPDVPVKLTGTIIIDADASTGIGGIDLTRPEPFDWKAQGFLVGQPVEITGFPGVDVDRGRLLRRRPHRHDRQHPHAPRAGRGARPSTQIASAAPYDDAQARSPTTDTRSTVGRRAARSSAHDGGNWLARRLRRRPACPRSTASPVTGPSSACSTTTTTASSSGSLLEPVDRRRLADGSAATRATVTLGRPGRDRRRRAGGADRADHDRRRRLRRLRHPHRRSATGPTSASWRASRSGSRASTARGACAGSRTVQAGHRHRLLLRLERGVALPTIATADDPDGLLAGPARRPHRRPRRRQQPAQDQLPDGHRPVHADGGHRHGQPPRRRLVDRQRLLVGQRVQVGGTGSITWTIVGFVNSDCPFADPFPGCGLDSTLLLHRMLAGGTAVAADADPDRRRPRRQARDPRRRARRRHRRPALMNVTVQPTGPLGLPTTTLTCVDRRLLRRRRHRRHGVRAGHAGPHLRRGRAVHGRHRQRRTSWCCRAPRSSRRT